MNDREEIEEVWGLTTLEAADGTELYVERFGPETGGSGVPIIFSCAYSTTRVNWYPQATVLANAGHRVGLWDYRGHGLSEAPADADRYSIDHVVSDLGRVMDWLAPGERCVLAGLSFGGLASLHLTRTSPERVRALVLADSGPGYKNPEAAKEWKQRTERTANYIVTRGFEALVTGKAGPTCVGNRPELPAAQAAAEAIKAQDREGVAHFARRVSALAPPVIDDLAGMQQSALVVVGEHDKAFLRAAKVMAAKLPNSQYEVIADAGHIVNIEQADVFNGLVLKFLASLDDI